ncbi:LapA family protein [Methylopila sp. 73B]|uniref:lipopolysaccharide assembly protein LapA domain-containing protein n=1 Tax=Methylopila sp. 73B TaxID=1120792 RepID=UPI000375285B|nr:LapA family protein [Methylopila sp. 73B]
MTLRRLLTGLIGVPLFLILVLFAVANRQSVVVGFDPFSPEAPVLAAPGLPLFAVILAAVMLGVVIGGSASWFRQGKWRKEAKTRRAEVSKLEAETERAHREAAAARQALALPAPRREAA